LPLSNSRTFRARKRGGGLSRFAGTGDLVADEGPASAGRM
jgi:hypothetical protein